MQKNIGVIGAGIMGQGVAFQFAKFNHSIILIDTSQKALEKAHKAISDIHRLDILLQKQSKSPEGINPNPLGNIQFSTDLKNLAETDLIVENIPEVTKLKVDLYKALQGVVSEKTLVGINTSATPITKLASNLNVPENVLGLHFSNPVHLMPTVEMVRGYHTSDETIGKVNDILESVKMSSVIVNDSPGFVTNRVMLMYINEAIYCVQEGVSTPSSVDRIFRQCLSHKIGPLETADLIGLDTILYSLEVLYENFNDSKYRPCPLLRKMVDANQLGRKTENGFYKY